ncbi:riboflavin synthase [Heliobacterium undosum]|uniref:Riboflavin synthase n=1 Tax=Heliomicrobium undosum TaxID=121734 RepID=A0A845KYP5_9FIRM|nr:riboflavin synthase [Heliomicrobium undosum]MZP29057.1 riboflavin synthase [Heliomicrobium undosum]
MFTGIVEELGVVRAISRGARSAKIEINAKTVVEDVKLGDSIAVNGVCLTVVRFDGSGFTADVMAETIDRTALSELQPGHRVNLERAVRAGDRLGGHIVSGHIDAVGVIRGQERVDIAVVTEIAAPPELLRYVIPKGSIAIDGISLTVVDVFEAAFTVSLIPHTAGLTTLGLKKPGHKVNLEADVIGKYVERLLTGRIPSAESGRAAAAGKGSRLTREFLLENGY